MAKTMKIFALGLLAGIVSLALMACSSSPADSGGGTDLSGSSPAASSAGEVDLSEVMREISSQVDVPSMLAYDTEDLYSAYGIQAEDVKQSVAQVAYDSVRSDEIVMVEAVDADAAARVKECLDGQYQSKLAATQSYQPDQYAIIQQCVVRQQGNFVTMFVSPDADQMTSIFDAALAS